MKLVKNIVSYMFPSYTKKTLIRKNLQEIQAQGFLEILQLLDKETITKIKELLKNTDTNKLKEIMSAVVVEDNEIKINVTFSIKKGGLSIQYV